jgi:hypothetical protein
MSFIFDSFAKTKLTRGQEVKIYIKNDDLQVTPFGQLLKLQLLKHQLLKHQLFALKHQVSKTSTV